MKKYIVIVVIVIIILFTFIYFYQNKNEEIVEDKNYEIVADNLIVPWEVLFLPNGDLLVTERSGNLLRIGKDRRAISIDGVLHQGEGGLLGMALHPRFNVCYPVNIS